MLVHSSVPILSCIALDVMSLFVPSLLFLQAAMTLSRWLVPQPFAPSSPSYRHERPKQIQPIRRGYGKVLPYGVREQLRVATICLHRQNRHHRFEGVNYDGGGLDISRSFMRFYHFNEPIREESSSASTSAPAPKKNRGRPFQEGATMMTKEEYFRKNKSRGYTDAHYDRYVSKFYGDVHGVSLVGTQQNPLVQVGY